MVEFLGALIGVATAAVGLYAAVWKARKARAEAITAEGVSQGKVLSPSASQHEWWYVARRGKERSYKDGPFSSEQLRQLAAQGQLMPNEMVLKEGAQKWTAASTIEGLFGAHWLNMTAGAMIVVGVVAILLDLLMLQASRMAPGSACKLLMSVIHAGFGIFAAVEILRRKNIVIAYLGSIMGVGAWFWIMMVSIQSYHSEGSILFGLTGTVAGVGVGIWAFLTLLNKRVVAEFQGVQQVAEPKEMFKEVYKSKPLCYAVSGGLALLLILWVISMVQSGAKEKEPRWDSDRLQASDPSKRKALDQRLIGNWELVQGGDRHRWVDYDKTTMEITATGTVLFSATGKYNEDDSDPPLYRKGQRYETSFTGKAWGLADGTMEFEVGANEVFRMSADFGSDDDLLLVKTGKELSSHSRSLEGKWRRGK
ncbi:MAG TPA: DUF4339 domain-containing protein [Gemmataceae bacterium]|nr:DUF4339 domain-containing protein [Gemmataceae bacterium]